MNEKNRFMFGEAMIVLGFAYAVNGYLLPCIACGLTAVGISVREDSLTELKQDMILLPLLIILQLAVIRVSGLADMRAGLNVIVLCNTLFARIFVKESFAAVEMCIQGLISVMLVFMVFALMTPSGEFSVMQTLLIVVLMFAPLMGEYAMKVISEARKEMMMSVEEKTQVR